MESPTPVSRYVPSKKRVFLSGSSSSSSSGCKDVEVLEISPPVNQTPKPKLSKQKEVIYPEVIDVDMEDDCDDVMLTDGEVESSAKGKEPLSKLGLSNNESGSDILVSNNGASGLHDSVNPDDFGSSLFFGEDEWIDTYYEDILFDDYAMLESHFDHMDMPSGIEAPFPWLPISSQNNSNMPTATTSTNPSSQPQSDGVNLPPGLNSSHSLWPSKQIQVGDLSTSSSSSMTGTHMNASNKHIKAKFNPKWESSLGQKKPATSTSTANMSSQSYKGSFTRKFDKEPLHAFVKTKRKPCAVSSMYHNQFAGAPSYPTPLNGGGSHPTLTPPPSASSVGPFVPPLWTGLSMSMFEPFLGPPPSGLMHESPSVSWAQKPANSQNGVSSTGTSPPTKIEQRIMDVVLLNFNNFKKFDTVEDYSDHHYAKNGYCAKQVQPPKNWAKRIQEEWKILERDLPDKIFVRVYESRMDLLRAVIVGAEGTPYHDGLFFFDVFFPGSYPNVPPHVHYHSGGLRINPNLYNCGKVCLSLLNTWSGSQKEKWIPGVSTMLQVLVSIQGLILNAKPYFNEPGYANLSGSINGEQRSLEYNERTFMYSLQTMMYNMRRPPKYFEDFVVGHFCEHARDILVSCKAYLEGAQVGCLVKGGVQDVDEGDKSCSQHFKNNLAGFITVLVNTFTEIGAKDCQEFLSLAPKENAKPSGPPSGLTFFN